MNPFESPDLLEQEIIEVILKSNKFCFISIPKKLNLEPTGN